MTERIFYLDGSRIKDLEDLHDVLAECFSFPAYYGRNLDALWDLLTERREGGQIVLFLAGEMPRRLREPLESLFLDLQGKNPKWQFMLLGGLPEDLIPSEDSQSDPDDVSPLETEELSVGE